MFLYVKKKIKCKSFKNTIYFIPPFKLHFLVGCSIFYINVVKAFLQDTPPEEQGLTVSLHRHSSPGPIRRPGCPPSVTQPSRAKALGPLSKIRLHSTAETSAASHPSIRAFGWDKNTTSLHSWLMDWLLPFPPVPLALEAHTLISCLNQESG